METTKTGRVLAPGMLIVWLGSYFAARALIPTLPDGSSLKVGAALLPLSGDATVVLPFDDESGRREG